MDSLTPYQNPNPQSPKSDPHSLIPTPVSSSYDVKATPLAPKPSFSNHSGSVPLDLNAPCLIEQDEEEESMTLVLLGSSGENEEVRFGEEDEGEGSDSRALVVVAAEEENRNVEATQKSV